MLNLPGQTSFRSFILFFFFFDFDFAEEWILIFFHGVETFERKILLKEDRIS